MKGNIRSINISVFAAVLAAVVAGCNGQGGREHAGNDAADRTDGYEVVADRADSHELAANRADSHDSEDSKGSKDSWAYLVNEDVKASKVSGSTMTYGSHSYTMAGNIGDDYRKGATGRVTFTNIPSGFVEFKTVYEQFLGTTPYGTAAMLPMAFEIWARDNATGERCLELLCYEVCLKEILRELPRHIVHSKYGPSDDPYVQRCMTAAPLAGATKENGYNPQEPYTLTMSIGQQNTWKQESELLQGYRYTLDIVAGGNAWNSPKRSVSLQRGWKDGLYKANACGSLYINIYAPRKSWNGLK